MADASSLFGGGGGIPTGDQYRETAVITLPDNTLTTVLSESGGTGGLVYGMYFVASTSVTEIQEVRTTIDGTSERTWDWSGFFLYLSKTTSNSNHGIIWLNTPIDYDSAVTIKIRHDDTSGSQCYAKAIYSLKN